MLKAVKGFEAFCSSDKNGLCVIALPTGVGKTYQIIDQIAQDLLSGSDQTTIYTTPLKKNVQSAYDDILERLFTLRGIPFDKNKNPSFDRDDPQASALYSLYKEKVVLLRSNEDNIKLSLTKDTFECFEKSGFESENASELYHVAQIIKGLEERGIFGLELNLWKNSFQERERAFRDELRKWISSSRKKGQTIQQFLLKHPWLGELYPSTRVDCSKVVLLSIDKFISFDDPLFYKKRPFYLRDYVKGSLVFIDEFDATKEWILRRQLQEASSAAIDLTRSHFQILSRLTSHYPYSEFDDGKEPNSPKVMIPWLRDKFVEESNRYYLDYTIKIANEDLKNGVYLFDDGVNVRLVTSRKGYVSFALDKHDRNQLRLSFSSKKEEGCMDFIPTVEAFSKCRKLFISSAVKMCRYYFEHRSIEEKTYDATTAVSTIMDPFNDGQLTQAVMEDYALLKPRPNHGSAQHDVYYDGFRYYCFEDDDDKELTTSLSMIELRETPEKWLISLCQNAQVVGLSATAEINTVTGNYDLGFVTKELGDRFYRLSSEEKGELKQLVAERLNDGQTEVVPISSPEDEDEMPLAVFDTEDNRETLAAKLFSSGSESYKKERFIRFLAAIKNFISSDGMVMLLMSTDNPNPNASLYSLDNITEFCSLLHEELGRDQSGFRVFALVGNQYEKQLQDYLNWMSVEGHRALLLSSYQSAGTGQNMQYEISLDDFGVTKQDIDTLYLEYPTHVVVDLSKSFAPEMDEQAKNENLLRFLYQVEAAYHSLELSENKSHELIDLAFKMRCGHARGLNGALNQTRSAINHRVKILMQAVGRICRVGKDENSSPRPKKTIYVDSQILGIDFSCAAGKLLNPEFERLVKFSAQQKAQANDPRINEGVNNSSMLISWINSVLGHFDNESMATWKAIRSYALSHPTISKEELDPSFAELYLNCAAGKYFTDGSENFNEISWKKTKECPVEISEKTSRLPLLMKISEIRSFFEANGYATAFGRGELMLNPVAFVNIYLGALGEACGRALLEHDGFLLSEINDAKNFEVLDFILQQNPNVYIDFKHWKAGTKANKEHDSETFKKKLEIVGGKCAFVINILSDRHNPHSDGPIHFFPSLLKFDGKNVVRDEKSIFRLETLLGKEQ